MANHNKAKFFLLYLGFTCKFSFRPDVADFWQTMADDENEYRQILSGLREHILEEDIHLVIDAKMAERAEKLKRLNVHQLVNSVRNLDDAYKIAYDLESSEVNTIFNFLTIRFLPAEKSHSIITATIDRHLLRLADFTRTFGDAEQCKHIASSG